MRNNTQGNYFCWNKLPKDIFSFEQARYPWEGCALWDMSDTAKHCEYRDFVQYSTGTELKKDLLVPVHEG